MYYQCPNSARLVEPTRGTRMLPYAETLVPIQDAIRWINLDKVSPEWYTLVSMAYHNIRTP